MSLPQLDDSRPAPLPRAKTTSGRWITSTEVDGNRSPGPAATVPDLRQAAALLEAVTHLHESGDPQTLLHTIAVEALRLLPADGVVVLTLDKTGPAPLLSLPSTDCGADPASTAARCRRLGAAHLLKLGEIADLDHHRPHHLDPSGGDHGLLETARWRSLVVAELDSPPSGPPTRVLWYARTAHAFTTSADLAVLFARHASLVLRTVRERHHLEQAIAGRTIVGQATGIVMCRYRLTAERAFSVLKRYSQDRNIKMRAVAETLIRTGDLPP